MRRPLIPAALTLTFLLAVAGCTDAPTAPNSRLDPQVLEAHRPSHDRGSLTTPVTGTLEDGGSFTGTVQITAFDLVDGVLMATGVLAGTATDAGGASTVIAAQAFEATAGLL